MSPNRAAAEKQVWKYLLLIYCNTCFLNDGGKDLLIFLILYLEVRKLLKGGDKNYSYLPTAENIMYKYKVQMFSNNIVQRLAHELATRE